MERMYLHYKQRRNQWVISVTYPSGATRTYGPITYKNEARKYLDSRLVAHGTATPRGRDIVSAKVKRYRRQADFHQHDLLGVRLVLPA